MGVADWWVWWLADCQVGLAGFGCGWDCREAGVAVGTGGRGGCSGWRVRVGRAATCSVLPTRQFELASFPTGPRHTLQPTLAAATVLGTLE